MAASAENPFWDDVLRRGERSPYARWFDVAWRAHTSDRPRVVLPVLGDEPARVIERGELSVGIVDGHPRVRYFQQSFPLDESTLPPELQLAQIDLEEAGEATAVFAGDAGRARLLALLDAQHYRLVSWRDAPALLNYRRFFDVNDLVALRAEDPAVFDATHRAVLRLVADGVIDGLRIDHVDGLLDPRGYLRRLRASVPAELPIVVEKILAPGERLPDDWPVDGTTGYEFLNDVESALIAPAGFAAIERRYRRMRRLGERGFAAAACDGKRRALTGPLAPDVARLAHTLTPIAHARGARWTEAEWIAPLVEWMVALPVYRTYVADEQVSPADRAVIDAAAAVAAERAPVLADRVAMIAGIVRGGAAPGSAELRFIERLQQVSGPAMAKGVEDTALYAYVPLASRNEVGGAPDRPLEDAVDALHAGCARRAARWPRSLLGTSTHDTKRSGDLRARLDVLSEMPREWERAVARWRRLNARHRRVVRGRMAPDVNDEYVFYQMLIGLWPAPRPGRRADDLPDRAWRDGAAERLTRYALKAAREAKTRTTWIEPNAGYEDALRAFIAGALEPADDAPFLTDAARLVARIAPAGAANAIARVAVQLTAPGTPDLYQGDELWNLALVDPDNRRAVDYGRRTAALDELGAVARGLDEGGRADLGDGRVKLHVTQRLLATRRDHRDLVRRGAYHPLEVRGPRHDHVIAFARVHDQEILITVAGRLLCDALAAPDPRGWWGDTAVLLPDGLSAGDVQPRLASCALERGARSLEVGSALGVLPAFVATR